MVTGSRVTWRWGSSIRPIVVACMVLAGVSMAAQPTHALTYSAIYNVNSTADSPWVGPGCVAANGQCTFRAAATAASNLPFPSTVLINIPSGTYSITLGAVRFLKNTIYVYGAGMNSTILQSNGNDRVIENGTPNKLPPTHAANLTIQDLTITGGDATQDAGSVKDGGGVLNSGNLSLLRVHITHNFAENGGGVAIIGDDAFYPTTITDSYIDYNEALSGDGGGINNTQTLTLHNDDIDFNLAMSFLRDAPAEGGGIFNGNHLQADRGTVNNNQAVHGIVILTPVTLHAVKTNISQYLGSLSTDSKGGAIFNTDNSSQVNNIRMSGNGAGQGGAVYNQSQLTLAGDRIISNRAGCAGGGTFNAAALDPSSDTPTLTMSDLLIYSNRVGFAGFETCAAAAEASIGFFPHTMSGAGIYNDGNETITGAQIELNSFYTPTKGAGVKSGVVKASDGYQTVCGIEITCGGGLYAGGVVNPGPTSTPSSDLLTNVRFMGNQAQYGVGGGVFEGQGNLTMLNGYFAGNRATGPDAGGRGGAIFDDFVYPQIASGNARVLVSNSQIIGNYATNEGGGIWNATYGQVLISGGALLGNVAPDCPNWDNGAEDTTSSCT